jgi:hypothetical protein
LRELRRALPDAIAPNADSLRLIITAPSVRSADAADAFFSLDERFLEDLLASSDQAMAPNERIRRGKRGSMSTPFASTSSPAFFSWS